MPTPSISMRKRAFTSSEILTLCGTDGTILFDKNTERIYVGTKTVDNTTEPIMFGTPVKNVVWDGSGGTLTITKIDGASSTINLLDATSGSQPNSLLCGLRDDVNLNKSSIQVLNGSGVGSVSGQISNAVSSLDGSAAIASKSGNVVTIKAGINETDGIVSNASGSDIVLNAVAVTGSSSDISVNYTIGSQSTNTMQDAVTNIASRLSSLESAPSVQTIVCDAQASKIPAGVTYYDGSQTIQGTMAASASTVGNIYLVANGVSSYNQYVTTQNGNNYVWTSLGSTTVDLTGYAKTITLNGTPKSVTSGTTDIALGNLLNSVSITGDSYISFSVSGYTSGYDRTENITAAANTHAVSTASQGSDGLATAYDVKTYVGDNLTTVKTWTTADIIPNV